MASEPTFNRNPYSYRCPFCGMTSPNPTDVRERFCGHCGSFLADILNAGDIAVAIGKNQSVVMTQIGVADLEKLLNAARTADRSFNAWEPPYGLRKTTRG